MMLRLGARTKPRMNIDDAHNIMLDQICEEYNLSGFTKEDRNAIRFNDCVVWPDFKEAFSKLSKS